MIEYKKRLRIYKPLIRLARVRVEFFHLSPLQVSLKYPHLPHALLRTQFEDSLALFFNINKEFNFYSTQLALKTNRLYYSQQNFVPKLELT
jgi:hypothetical protein